MEKQTSIVKRALRIFGKKVGNLAHRKISDNTMGKRCRNAPDMCQRLPLIEIAKHAGYIWLALFFEAG
ncbi:hypothetical protein [Paraburkholderia xenovorans]|nr:hypothetical protein [Paraburkholderia xenovorans]